MSDMSTAYCIDVSGSVPGNLIEKAFAFVEKGLEPGDCVIAFDAKAVLVSPEQLKNPSQFVNRLIGGGGTCAEDTFKLIKQLGVNQSILISDGMMLPEQLARFSKFLNIEKL